MINQRHGQDQYVVLWDEIHKLLKFDNFKSKPASFYVNEEEFVVSFPPPFTIFPAPDSRKTRKKVSTALALLTSFSLVLSSKFFFDVIWLVQDLEEGERFTWLEKEFAFTDLKRKKF